MKKVLETEFVKLNLKNKNGNNGLYLWYLKDINNYNSSGQIFFQTKELKEHDFHGLGIGEKDVFLIIKFLLGYLEKRGEKNVKD